MVQLTQSKTADALTDRADVIDIEPLDAAEVLPGVHRRKNRIAGCVWPKNRGHPSRDLIPECPKWSADSMDRLFLAGNRQLIYYRKAVGRRLLG